MLRPGGIQWAGDPWGLTAHSQESLQWSHRVEPAQVRPFLAGGGGRQLLAMGAQCLGHRIATVARKGGTSHFLKYNQRPHHYFPGADTVPLSWSQVPSEAGWPGSKPGPGMSGFGASSSRPGNSQERPWPGLPTPGSLRLSLTWAVLTFLQPQESSPCPPQCRLGAFLPLPLDFYELSRSCSPPSTSSSAFRLYHKQ